MTQNGQDKILIVVDMQADFIDGALGTPEAAAILPAVRARIALARARGEKVAFTRDTHGAEYLATQEGKRLPVPHCIRGEKGWQIADGLYAAAGCMRQGMPASTSPASAPSRSRNMFRKKNSRRRS